MNETIDKKFNELIDELTLKILETKGKFKNWIILILIIIIELWRKFIIFFSTKYYLSLKILFYINKSNNKKFLKFTNYCLHVII